MVEGSMTLGRGARFLLCPFALEKQARVSSLLWISTLVVHLRQEATKVSISGGRQDLDSPVPRTVIRWPAIRWLSLVVEGTI